MRTIFARTLFLACLITCLAPNVAATAGPELYRSTAHGAHGNEMEGKLAVRRMHIKFSVTPHYAAVGQALTVKGRVVGANAARPRVKIIGVQRVTKRVTRDGRFRASVTLPADRTILVCLVRSRCQGKYVSDIPDYINHTWINDEAYSFSTIITGMATTDINVDTLNAPPGEAIVSVGFAGVAAVTNETDGHNAPTDKMWLVPVFAGTSTLCQVTSTQSSHFWATSTLELTNDPPVDSQPIPYCAFRGGLGAPTGDDIGILAPGQTAYKNFAVNFGGQPFRISFSVPEAQAATIAADLASPDFWGLSMGLGGTTAVAHECITWSALVATSDGGMGLCAQGVQ